MTATRQPMPVPLIAAAKVGNATEVRALLAAGADINELDRTKRRALHWAALDGHTAVVEALLANRANINLYDDGGFTALQLASRYGQDTVVEALLASGADVDIRDRYVKLTLRSAQMDVIHFFSNLKNAKDRYWGGTALHW